jgi:hypothetical protein
MLSTYTVTSLSDDYTAGTLIYEIANAPAGPQTIVFSPALAGGTVDLEAGTTLILDHSSGQLTIQASAGTTVTIEAAGGNAGVMMVAAGTTAELDGLIITGGNTNGNGGGIDNDGTLILNDCTVTGNVANGNGGGIANEAGATATINDSTITNNTAHGGGASEPIQVNGPTSASSNGSYSNDGDTFAAAFDGNTDTYFDAPGSDGNWIELDLGSPTLINEIAYAPRVGWESRMEGGVFYASNDPTFSNPSDIETLYVIGSTAPADGLTYQTVNTDNGRYEFVRYNAPAGSYGNIAEMQVFNESGTTGGILSPLSGVPSANTLASYDDSGNDYLKAFDGSINTYFDSPDDTGNWIQMDLGSNPPVIDQISYAPRADWESRMVGGTFQASNSANFSTGVVNLFTITATPVDGYTSDGVNPGAAYEYIRYQSPADSYGNIAEMQVYTMDGTGAGIYNAPDTGSATNSLSINNCTITGNIAPGRFGGAIAGGNATINIADSTITQNTGGGIAAEGTISVNDTIAANNQGQDLSIDADSAGSYDLIGDGSGGLATGSGNIFGTVTSPVNPELGDLQNNGGLTDTMAPLINSQLLEAGEAITGLTTDQRGQPRPATGVDIGAYQTQPLAITISPEVLTSESDPNIYVGQPTNFLIQASETAAAAVTGFTVHFGDGDSQTISTPPTIADGGYYQWSVQHIYQSTPSTGSSFTVTATPIGTPETSTVPSTSVWVAATNDSGLTITGITVESSTQVYITWSLSDIGPFDSFEVAASSAASPDYTVVAAAPQGYSGGVLVNGLLPSTEYSFLVYGVYGDSPWLYGTAPSGAGSICSESSMSATTGATPVIFPYEDIFGGTINIDGYAISDGLANTSYEWEGFDVDGNGTSLGTGSSISTSEQYASVTVVATIDGAQSGAFDSVSFYTAAPTIVVTGTSGNDTFAVSNPNGGSGPYTVTGSVTAIPPFYTLNGINLNVEGRGGSDTLTIGSHAIVSLISNPSLLAITNNGTYSDAYSAPTAATNTAPTGLPAPATLPTYSILSPPSGTDAFTLSTSSTASTAGLITQATATAAPGDVIALTAEDVSSSTSFYVYGQTTSGNGDWEAATIESEADAGSGSTAVSIQLASTLPPNSIYYLYELNGSTYSTPYQINQPQIWWTDQNNAYAGGKVSLFGTNLSYGADSQPYSDHTWVYLFPQGITGETSPILISASAVAPAADGSGAMDVNPYKVDFNLPSSIAAGTYDVEVYNGHGGVNALSNAMSLYVAAAPSGSNTATFTLQTAYDNYLELNGEPLASVYLDNTDTQIDPFAVNHAILWASLTYIADNTSIQYATIVLPTGEIDVQNSMDQIFLFPHVHLVGAGDTGNNITGTSIQASPNQSLQDLVNIYDPGNNPYYAQNEAIAGMSLITNGSVYAGGAAVYCPASVDGFTISDVTINSTTDNPTAPGGADDVYVNNGLSHGQFVDSTFIGAGVFGYFQYYSIDNCHFIGCGTVGDVISTLYATDFSITRCTDASVVNNITSPGGNVELDSDKGIVFSGETGPGIYVGENTTNDAYNVESSNGDGEQVSFEPGSGYNMSITVYQNALSGDGFESLQSNLDSVGVSVNDGVNIVVADNDISNVVRGIDVYNGGTVMPFAMFADNSIHNVNTGLYIQIDLSTSVPNTPWFICNSFNDNLINGIQNFPSYHAPVPAAIYVIIFPPNSNNPPQALGNIFCGNMMTGTNAGLVMALSYVPFGSQITDTVLSDNFFASDGSPSSRPIDDTSGTSSSPVISVDDTYQGFWEPPSL